MRLGKKKEKEKDTDPKNQVIDSVLRLICSPKTHNYPLTSKKKYLFYTFVNLNMSYFFSCVFMPKCVCQSFMFVFSYN